MRILNLSRFALAAVLATLAGCASLSVPSLPKMLQKEEPVVVPSSLAVVWTTTVVEKGTVPGTRGFGGIVTFYDAAAGKPPSRYRAATTASSASANKAPFARPPVFSSPRPSRRCRPSSSRAAASPKCTADTKLARARESLPSGQAGKASAKRALTRKFSTASPRNSSCSLSRTCDPDSCA